MHELEHRVAAALRARTYADLDATVADLPGGRVGRPRPTTASRAVVAVREHPALLIVAVPVALVVVATVVAITVMWTVLMVLLFVLGHRRHGYRNWGPPGPFGPPRRAYRRGPAGSAYWRV